MVTNKLEKIIKIKSSIHYSPLCKPLLKADSGKRENKIFNKYKNILEIFLVFQEFYKGNSMTCDDLKNKKYIYNIPSDVYQYLKYDGNKIIINNDVCDELKTKTKNCAKYLELELNYLNHLINVNFEQDDFFVFNCIKKLFKPTIIINHSTDKISFDSTYEQIIDNEYFKDYEKLLNEEKIMIESGEYII